MSSIQRWRWPRSRAAGAANTPAARRRSAFIADTNRAYTASAISVTGVPRSCDVDHRPLAGALLAGGVEDLVDSGWPSASRVARMSRVISIR
jgi:hypothetical protein